MKGWNDMSRSVICLAVVIAMVLQLVCCNHVKEAEAAAVAPLDQ